MLTHCISLPHIVLLHPYSFHASYKISYYITPFIPRPYFSLLLLIITQITGTVLFICCSLNVVVTELSTVWRVMSLPLLEPLNAVHLQKLSTIAMAALLAALTVAAATAIIAVASQGTSSSKVLLSYHTSMLALSLNYLMCPV